jgi:hypothetical protein
VFLGLEALARSRDDFYSPNSLDRFATMQESRAGIRKNEKVARRGPRANPIESGANFD